MPTTKKKKAAAPSPGKAKGATARNPNSTEKEPPGLFSVTDTGQNFNFNKSQH